VTLGSGQRPATQIALVRRDPSHQLTQTLLDLNSRGDAIALTTPSGRHVLIDSGLTHEAATRIGELLPDEASLSIVLTHPDADHIGNIVPLSRTNRLKIDELLMSSYQTDSQRRQYLVAELESLGYQKHDLPDAAMSLWTQPAGNGIQFLRVPLSPGIGNRNSKIALFTAKVEEGVTVDVMQLRNPRNSNESSILTSILHNGHRTLYAGDMSVSVMRVINEHVRLQTRSGKSSAERSLTPIDSVLPLRADTFKWPHHAWLPSNESDRAVVAEFLANVNPSRVLISVGPEDLRGQSVEAVKGFLKDRLPRVKVFVTRDDGHVRLNTRVIAELFVDAA
jgi:beta-lactamase superfamily II metal-dependent hydrolase